MCYTGLCDYEGYMGDCTLGPEEGYPKDAGCVVLDGMIEKLQEEETKKEQGKQNE
jgi:hypothetical protein